LKFSKKKNLKNEQCLVIMVRCYVRTFPRLHLLRLWTSTILIILTTKQASRQAKCRPLFTKNITRKLHFLNHSPTSNVKMHFLQKLMKNEWLKFWNRLRRQTCIRSKESKSRPTNEWNIHTISPTNTATNTISVDQPYAGPAASCCSINETHSISHTFNFAYNF
jgi:hypothetical protein